MHSYSTLNAHSSPASSMMPIAKVGKTDPREHRRSSNYRTEAQTKELDSNKNIHIWTEIGCSSISVLSGLKGSRGEADNSGG
ncbi:hypothetical protein FKM82_013354 [Ascaphus truei]